MPVDGARADGQVLGNLRIRPALGQQPQHFHFAGGEIIGIGWSTFFCWRYAGGKHSSRESMLLCLCKGLFGRQRPSLVEEGIHQ